MPDTSSSPFARWHTLPLTHVTLSDGFWSTRQQISRDVSLMHGFRMLVDAGNLHNLRLAAHAREGDYRGPVFMDSDVYKWLEAVANASVGGISQEVRQAAEEAITLVQAAQRITGRRHVLLRQPADVAW